jgi:undecaprenyl-diphosphatase
VPHLATLFIGTGGAVLLNLMLEYTFRRAHSVTANEFVTVAQGISFPSGHSMISVVVYGILAYFATLSTRLPKPRQMVSVGGAAMIIVLIGLARVYLGVHTVSDVVLGCVAGVLWLAACIIGHPMLAASVAKARLTPSSPMAVVEPLASN